MENSSFTNTNHEYRDIRFPLNWNCWKIQIYKGKKSHSLNQQFVFLRICQFSQFHFTCWISLFFLSLVIIIPLRLQTDLFYINNEIVEKAAIRFNCLCFVCVPVDSIRCLPVNVSCECKLCLKKSSRVKSAR